MTTSAIVIPSAFSTPLEYLLRLNDIQVSIFFSPVEMPPLHSAARGACPLTPGPFPPPLDRRCSVQMWCNLADGKSAKYCVIYRRSKAVKILKSRVDV